MEVPVINSKYGLRETDKRLNRLKKLGEGNRSSDSHSVGSHTDVDSQEMPKTHQSARKRTSSSSPSSPGRKYKNRTRAAAARLLSTSCSKQGRVNNNRVPKRLKSQSKPSLSKVQLRSRRRGAEPLPSAGGQACPLGLRDAKVSHCKGVTVKKEKDGQEVAQLPPGTRSCLTRHAAKEHGSFPAGASGVGDQGSAYRTRRSTRTLGKSQEPAAGVKLEPSAMDGLSPVPGGVVIKTEPADMEEYLQHGSGPEPPPPDARRGRKRPTRLRTERTIKCEGSNGEPFMPAAAGPDFSDVLLSFADRHRDYNGVANSNKALRRDKGKSGCRSQDKAKKKRRITRYDAQLILENNTGIPKLTLRRRRDSSSSKTNDPNDLTGPAHHAVNSASSSKISIKFSKDHDKDKGGSYIAKLNNGFAPVVHGNATKLKIQLKREEDARRLSHAKMEPVSYNGDTALGLESRNGGHRTQKVPAEPSSDEEEEEQEEGDEDDEDDYFDNDFDDDFIPLPPAKRLRLIVGKDSIDIDISSRRREDQSLRLNA